MWSAFHLLKAITLLPHPQRLWIGRLIGKILYAVSPKRRAIADINLELCFPDWSAEKRAEVIKKQFLSLGMAFINTGVAWWAADDKIKYLANVHGLEYLESAVKQGRGVILLSAHFTHLEFGLRLLRTHTDHPLMAVYQPNSNALLDELINTNRMQKAKDVISYKDIKKMIRYLKNNEIIWYAPDQGYKGKYYEMVPFFGIPAASNTATSRLARFNNSVVLPFFTRHAENGESYEVTLLPPLDNFPSDDVLKDTERYHHLIEEEVRKSPEQYLWIHRRFKKRPAEYPDLYKDIALRK